MVDQCIICCEKERDALYMPCKHNAACLACSKQLDRCPCCKQPIEELVKIYKMWSEINKKAKKMATQLKLVII